MNIREKIARFISPSLAKRADEGDNHAARLAKAVQFDAIEYENYKAQMAEVFGFSKGSFGFIAKKVPRRPVDPMVRALLHTGGLLPRGEVDHGTIELEIDGYINHFRKQDRIASVHVTRALIELKRRIHLTSKPMEACHDTE